MESATGRLLRLARTAGDADQPEVLDAALSAFLDYGIKRTSMGEIARRAGISPATLYRRFAQKNDIVFAVGLREVRRFVETVDDRVDVETSAEDQIVELFVAFAAGLQQNKLLRRILDTEPETVLPLLTVRGAPVLQMGRDYVAEFIGRLQGEGKIAAFDPLPVAEMIARVALSTALTPETVIPLSDEDAARRFAREHMTLLFGLPTP